MFSFVRPCVRPYACTSVRQFAICMKYKRYIKGYIDILRKIDKWINRMSKKKIEKGKSIDKYKTRMTTIIRMKFSKFNEY